MKRGSCEGLCHEEGFNEGDAVKEPSHCQQEGSTHPTGMCAFLFGKTSTCN